MTHPIIQLLRAKMRLFKNNLYSILQRDVEWAPVAEVAQKLGTRTPTQVIADLNAVVEAHTGQLRVAIHGENAEMLGAYNRAYMQDHVDNTLKRYSDETTISYYGDPTEYLPPDITGSFGNSVTPIPYGGVAMLLENNGTLVMLRPGTDGSDMAIYYAYLLKGEDYANADNWRLTNQVYRPSFLPAGTKVLGILSSNHETIVGLVANDAGARVGYFCALTNGTLDQTKHNGVYIPNGNFLNITYTNVQEQGVGSFILGAYYYVLVSTYTNNGYARNTPGFVVWRLNLADVVKNQFTGATKITNWTINRGSGGQVTRNDLILADHMQNLFNTDQGQFYDGGSRTWVPSVWSVIKDERSQRVCVSHVVQYRSAQGNFGTAVHVMGFDINPETRVVDVSRYYNSKTMVYAISSVQFVGGAGYTTLAARATIPVNGSISVYGSELKSLWCFSIGADTGQNAKYTYLRFNSGSNINNWLEFNDSYTRFSSWHGLGMQGGPLGTNFHALGILSENIVTTWCITKYSRLTDPQYLPIKANLDGGPTYQYKSATGRYNNMGFQPTTNRSYLASSTLGSQGVQAARLISNTVAEVQGSTLLVHGGVFHNFHASFADYNNSYQMLTRPDNINTVPAATGGMIYTSASFLTVIRGKIESHYASLDILGMGGYDYMTCTIVAPMLLLDLPVFAIGCLITVNGRISWFAIPLIVPEGFNRRWMMDPVDVELDIDRAYIEMPSNAPGGPWRNTSYLTYLASQIAIRRIDAGILIVAPINGIQSSQFGAVSTVISTLWIEEDGFFGMDRAEYAPSGAPIGALNFPTRGLYLALSSEAAYGVGTDTGNIDYGTKLVSRLYANNGGIAATLTQMVNALYTANEQNNIIIFSQQTTRNWTLYFNTTQPLMIWGYYRTLPVYTHNFIPGTHANKVFSVWACIDRGGSPDSVPYYAITEEGQQPFPIDNATGKFHLYLGRVTTDNLGISRIEVTKNLQVGPYLISTTSRGSAVPVSSGLPSNTGKLNWR